MSAWWEWRGCHTIMPVIGGPGNRRWRAPRITVAVQQTNIRRTLERKNAGMAEIKKEASISYSPFKVSRRAPTSGPAKQKRSADLCASATAHHFPASNSHTYSCTG